MTIHYRASEPNGSCEALCCAVGDDINWETMSEDYDEVDCEDCLNAAVAFEMGSYNQLQANAIANIEQAEEHLRNVFQARDRVMKLKFQQPQTTGEN